MFVKVAVFITAISFVSMLVMTLRQRMRVDSTLARETKFPDHERKSFSERIYDLPLPQLEHKINELNQRKSLIKDNFLSMQSSDQYELLQEVAEINQKIKTIKEAIEFRRHRI